MEKKLFAIETAEAPTAIGPYSQAVVAGEFVYVSGQIALRPDTQRLIEGDVAQQAEQAFKNIQAIAHSAKTDLSCCVKINIAMVDLSDFDVVNKVMAQYFDEPYPARACIGVSALPKDALIEVESIFYRPEL